jgi:hypothetical protein
MPAKVAGSKAELERHNRRLEALTALQPKWIKMCDLQREVSGEEGGRGDADRRVVVATSL